MVCIAFPIDDGRTTRFFYVKLENITIENVINSALNLVPIYFYSSYDNHFYLVRNIKTKNTYGTIVIYGKVKYMDIENVLIENAGVYN